MLGKHTTDTGVLPLPQNAQLFLLVCPTTSLLKNGTNALRIVVQVAYTSIFGSYCCYLFLRSGSLVPPIAAHIFCNIMGVPQPTYEMNLMPHRKLCK
jgi:membrane protease YdiL (CAAX protease family)